MIASIFKRKKILLDILALILLCIIAIYVNSYLLTVPHFSLVGDAQRYNGYQAYVLKYSLDNFGQIALWDPFLASGMSWISHPGGAQFSPTAWLVTFFVDDIYLGSRLIIFIHTITAVIALYILFRILKIHRLPSLFIAIGGICNQYITVFIGNGWFEELIGVTLLPLTIGLLWLALEKNKLLYAIIAAIIMSLNFYINSYYVFHYNVISILWVTIVYGLYRLWKIKENKKELRREGLYMLFANGVFWIVFVALSAAKLVPLMEFRSISARNEVPLAIVEAAGNVMTPNFLYNYLKDFFIPAGQTNFFTQWGNNVAVILFLITVAYFIDKRSIKYGIFLGLFVLGVWGYLANYVPLDLYAFFYYFLPGFNSNMFPYRFFVVIHFALLVCIALGLDVFFRQKKKSLYLLGCGLGLVFVIAIIFHQINYNRVLSYPQSQNIKEELKKHPVMVQQNNNFHEPPIIKASSSANLFSILSELNSKYNPEGRIYMQNYFRLTNDIILSGELFVLQPSYLPVVPTYQYLSKQNIVPPMKTTDTLNYVKNRFKILSVLNARFQVQTEKEFEFDGCQNLSSSGTVTPTKEVCDFLESRLVRVASKDNGAIYYDKNVLPRYTTISYPLLLISDNKFHDYSGFIAKKIMFHENFNEKKMSILSGGSTFVDDYNIETLKQFKAIFIVDAMIRDKEKVKEVLDQYRKSGGNVFEFQSTWNSYDSLHNRSESLFTDKPAWDYSKADSVKLSSFFRSLSNDIVIDNIIRTKFTPEDIIYKITTKTDNEVLQYSDTFFPGWHATIDGKKVPLYMADGLVKGVIIPTKGSHEVRFYYSPNSFKIGLGISLITIVGIVVYSVFYFKKKKKKVKKHGKKK